MLKGMTPDVSVARDRFAAAMKRDISGAEQGRVVAVLDALLAWSIARPETVVLRAATGVNPSLCFERVGSRTFVWSARVQQGLGASLEVAASAGRALSPDDRAMVLESLNANSRTTPNEGDPLRISFSALKNPRCLEAILALIDRLLLTGKPVGAA